MTKRHWQFLSVGLGWKSLNTPLLWAPRCSANNHHHLQHDQHEYEHLNFICVVLSLEACNRGNVCNRGNGQIMRSLPSFYWSRCSLEPASPTYPCLASSVSSRSPVVSRFVPLSTVATLPLRRWWWYHRCSSYTLESTLWIMHSPEDSVSAYEHWILC